MHHLNAAQSFQKPQLTAQLLHRVDWGPSSVIFDDLLGLYYRTNRGILGMASKEQDRE